MPSTPPMKFSDPIEPLEVDDFAFKVAIPSHTNSQSKVNASDLNLLDDSMRKFEPTYIEQASMEFESKPKLKLEAQAKP